MLVTRLDRKSTRLNSSHGYISYAVFCLKKKKKTRVPRLLPPDPLPCTACQPTNTDHHRDRPPSNPLCTPPRRDPTSARQLLYPCSGSHCIDMQMIGYAAINRLPKCGCLGSGLLGEDLVLTHVTGQERIDDVICHRGKGPQTFLFFFFFF